MLNYNKVNVKSSFGHDINNWLITNAPEADHLLAFFPGMMNTCESPLLYYAREVALQAGCDALCIEYGYGRACVNFSDEFFASTLDESAEALRLCKLEQYRRVSFISKSFGTLIAGKAAERFPAVEIKHLFLTPVSHTVPFIQKGDCTVIYGAADSHFAESDAAQIAGVPKVQVVVLPGADHSLEIRGDFRASLRLLEQICGIYEAFVCGKH